MSAETHVRRMRASTAIEATQAALVVAGASPGHAGAQAEHLVEAELRGHPSHGLRRLPVLVERIRAGLLDPTAVPEFRWEASSALVVDGCLSFGPVVAHAAIDELVARTDETGVAVAALHRTHHLGMLAPYVERLAHSGCIGLVLSSTEGLVHPWAGAGALLGTNPLGASVPAPDGELVLDMSTGAVSAGKILDYADRGQPLPAGWAVDAEGRPTTDAADAARGAISPFGGPKGYALGLTLGAIVGSLTGTEYGPGVKGTLDAAHAVTKGDVIVAIRVESFQQPVPSGPLGAYLDLIRASGPDGQPVTIPGDRARAARSRALADGFDISDEVWATTMRLAGFTNTQEEQHA